MKHKNLKKVQLLYQFLMRNVYDKFMNC